MDQKNKIMSKLKQRYLLVLERAVVLCKELKEFGIELSILKVDRDNDLMAKMTEHLLFHLDKSLGQTTPNELSIESINSIVRRIAKNTQYPENHIHEFLLLSNIQLCQIEHILTDFSKKGISNIKDISLLIKMGVLDSSRLIE